jgi:predicted component of type VI protein secretion system
MDILGEDPTFPLEDPPSRPKAPEQDPAPSSQPEVPSSSSVSKHIVCVTCFQCFYFQELDVLRCEMDEKLDKVTSSFNGKIDGIMQFLQARLPAHT